MRRDERVHAPGDAAPGSRSRDTRRAHPERGRARRARTSTSSPKKAFWRRSQDEDDLDARRRSCQSRSVGPGLGLGCPGAHVKRPRSDRSGTSTGGDAVRAIACLGIVCFHVGTGALYATGNLEGSGGHFTWMTGYGEVGHRSALRSVVDAASTCSSSCRASSSRRPSWPRSWRAGRGRGWCPSSATARVRLVPAAWLLFAFVLLRHGAQGASPGELALDVHVHGRPGRPSRSRRSWARPGRCGWT